MMNPKRLLKLWSPLLVVLILGLLISVGLAQEFGSNWTAEYYTNASFTGDPGFVLIEPDINENWGAGGPALPGFPVDNFSIRYSGFQTFQAGVYQFSVGRDDSARLLIDNVLVLDASGTGPFTTLTAQVTLTGGMHLVVVEYVELTGQAAIQVQWSLVGAAGPTPTMGPSPTPLPTSLPPIPPGSITATVIRASVLNIRDAPSLGGFRIGRILRGQTYAVVGRNHDATWFLLQLGGYQGWAYGYYLFINGNEFTPPILSANTTLLPAGLTDTGVLAQARSTMRLRAAPTVNAMQTGRVTWGGFVPVLGRTADGVWWQVLWKGTVGWVWSPFFRIIEGDYSAIPIVNP